jgi:hypothetical protein
LFLLQEADTTHEWTADDISRFLRCQANDPGAQAASDASPLAVPAVTGSDGAEDSLSAVAARVAARLEPSEIEALIEAVENQGQVPRDIDAQLLAGARGEIGRDLNPTEKKAIRRHFIENLRGRIH